MMTIPELGRLEEIPFARLLLALHCAHFGGTLTLARRRVEKRFLFHQGVPVYAESNLASESLLLHLLDTERLSRQDYERAVAYVSREECTEGKALLDLSLIDARGLFAAIKDQVRLRLVECFGWPEGEFRTDASARPSPDSHALRSDPIPLIQEGIATHWGAERILADLAPDMERYPHRSRRGDDVAARLQSDASVEALVAGLDGQHTLWRALQAARTPQALAAAWVLREIGGLELAAAPHAAGLALPEVDLIVTQHAGAAPLRASRAAPRGSDSGPVSTVGAASRRADALRREIDEKFDLLGRIDHYRLLGQSRSAPPEALKQAYHRAAKTYHPDALGSAGLDEESRRRATRVFAEIGSAYALLSDPERRRGYDASLAGDRETIDADRLANAETNYRKGDILVRQGNFRAAVDYLRAAVELWPEEAAYQSALGWALFKKTPSEPKAARDHLERAVALAPHGTDAQARLVTLLRSLEDGEADES
jgi:tetratricopeptide (TPR) repeat protein